ncbi:MAG: SurA N-terminal domain-containing protein [Deltaproteobacteria bacterium]|nr:MAG: SurA N-terminal domain-containing protein [Deltaproteobacteria bacterium]
MTKKQIALLIVALCFYGNILSAEVVDKVVAVVGSDIITLSDVNKFKSQKNSQLKKNFSIGTSYSTNTTDVLQALIEQKLVDQEIERLQITASPEDTSSAIQEVLHRNKASLDELKAELSKKGTSFEKYKLELTDQIKHMKFMGQVIYPRIKISEGELAKKAANSTDEARFQARVKILEERSPEELEKYINEVRAKTLVEIK